jgi:hypothetical protein
MDEMLKRLPYESRLIGGMGPAGLYCPRGRRPWAEFGYIQLIVPSALLTELRFLISWHEEPGSFIS